MGLFILEKKRLQRDLIVILLYLIVAFLYLKGLVRKMGRSIFSGPVSVGEGVRVLN